MGETKDRQTHTTGEVYTHPRGPGYDNYDSVFGKRCVKCRKGVEECQCKD